MDSGLLTCADTDGLTVFDVADRVGLGVFECNQADEQVDLCIFRQLFVLRNDVLEQVCVNLQIVSALLEGDTEHILVLDWLRNISRVDLDDVVGAFAFFFQDFQRLFGVARSDDAVGNLALDDSGGAGITNVRQSDEVAVGGHSVCTSGSCISAGDWGKLSQVIYKVDFFHGVVQRQTNSGACRRNVLEGSSCRKTGSFLQLLDQLPAVEGIQEVDVSRFAVEYLQRQFTAVFHKNAGWFLIWVASIFQRKLVCHN